MLVPSPPTSARKPEQLQHGPTTTAALRRFEQMHHLEMRSRGEGNAEGIMDRKYWLLECCKGISDKKAIRDQASLALLFVQLLFFLVTMKEDEEHL